MKILKWLGSLVGNRPAKPQQKEPTPFLLEAHDFDVADIGTVAWNADHNADLLEVSNDGLTVEWPSGREGSRKYAPAWVPAVTCLRLHSGRFALDLRIERLGAAQIGAGFMLLWDVGPDWGFFGYLGASPSAWSYDPSTGDVVTNTASVEGGLPIFGEEDSGVISIELELPRNSEGTGVFIVNDTKSQPIGLPKGAVVLPAACFLKQGQGMTIENFERT